MEAGAESGIFEKRQTVTRARKRKLTEDRRKQNREAQRRYRERRKAEHNVPEHDSDATGLLNATEAHSTQQIACYHGRSSFGLLPDWDQESPYEPMLAGRTSFEDMLLLDSAASDHATSISFNAATTPFPSPYKNHLTVQKLSFYAARIQNALHLGLPTFLAQKEDHISPWYWHTQFALLSSQEAYPDFTLPSDCISPMYSFSVPRPVRPQPCFTMSSSIIPDLSPTPLQRSHPHGMYLDMIPFPIFRDRAITLLSMNPPAFSEAELKRDIENEGLMVWGVGHGSATRGKGVVRDKRNWECARWFYSKWKLLVDGSGLDEQSQWWRTMRGEDSEDE